MAETQRAGVTNFTGGEAANGVLGHISVHVVKAMTEKIARFDARALSAALHGARISAAEPPRRADGGVVRQERRPRSGKLPDQGRPWQAGRRRDLAGHVGELTPAPADARSLIAERANAVFSKGPVRRPLYFTGTPGGGIPVA
ncbi:MAG: hypothetical protein KGN16_02615 [Burkholderiales bacterium]|nr:hypothetical protein [Burkholderiales bacterium]